MEITKTLSYPRKTTELNGDYLRAYLDWDAAVDAIRGINYTGTFISVYDYIIFASTIGATTYYYAVNGSQTVYGGSSNTGGVDGTDPSAVIQAVINALVGGGSVKFKAATYTLTTSILIPASTHDLVISCERGTIFTYPNSTSEMHVFYTADTGTDTYSRIMIEGLEFNGNLNGVTAPTTYEESNKLMPIYLNNCNDVVIRDCYFHDYWGFAICIHYCTVSNSYSGAWIINNRYYNAGKTGNAFHSGGGAYSSNADTLMMGNVLDTFYGTGLCLDEENGWIVRNAVHNLLGGGSDDFAIVTGYGAHEVTIDSNQIFHIYRRAIANKIGGADACPNHIVTNNIIDSEHGVFAAIDLSDTGHLVSGNVIKDWGSSTTETWADGIQIETSSDAIITNNRIMSVYRNGITVYGTAMVQGNYANGVSGSALACGCAFSGNNAAAYGPVTGNYFDGDYASIYFYQVNTTIYVRDNQFASAPLTSASANIYFTENIGYVTENCGTGSIASGATSDVITHGLAYTPTARDITITLTENPTNTPGAIWVDTITATEFTVNCENDPGASNLDFEWSVRKH